MQNIQVKRSKYKKSTKKYVQDNILDIIDIEETLLKNRFISKVQTSDFIYSKFLPKHDSLKPIIKSNNSLLKSIPQEERISPVIECKLYPRLKSLPKLILNPEKINYEQLNQNKFNINFKELKLEYKNGYSVLFIKEYYPVEIIGAGAFGLVVNVIQIKTGEKMAVKIIDKNNSNLDSDYLNKEVYILSILDNPRIMKIYDILDNNDYFFIFMELIEGGNLKDLIIKRYLDKNVYLFRDSECSQIMKGILEALNYLHKKNIIHRDIKPENILFKNKDDLSSVILCDFGLAYQMNEYENSTSGLCGTTIYMAPEVLLKKNYDYLVDSFSAGIVLYILCSGGMHPFYYRGCQQKEYIDKLISQKCLCKFSAEMPLLARNLFLKLCKFEPLFRYSINKALLHPWITRSSKSPIPLTIFEEYSKSDKIKTFKQLLCSMICLAGIKKKYFKRKRKKKEICKNNSYYDNLDKTYMKGNSGLNNQLMNINKKDKYLLLTSMKKHSRFFSGDSSDEKRVSPNKINLINSTLFNIKTTKNINKIKSPLIYPRPMFFIQNGIQLKNNNDNNNNNNLIENNNNNYESNSILKTQSFKENKNKEKKKKVKLKSNMKYQRMKSNSVHVIFDNIKDKEKEINNNKDKESIDIKTILTNNGSKKRNNLLAALNSASKSSKNNSHKLFLKKHIVIESKNKNIFVDTKKNNNSCTLSANKNNNEENGINNINLQMKNKLKELKKYNQMSNFQKMYNESKNQTKFYVLRNVFNNNDF